MDTVTKSGPGVAKRVYKTKHEEPEVLNLDIRSCRICLTFDKRLNMYSAFGSIGNDLSISKIVSDIFLFEIEETDILKQICEKCLGKIDITYGIHKEFTAANRRLEEIMFKFNIQRIIDEAVGRTPEELSSIPINIKDEPNDNEREVEVEKKEAVEKFTFFDIIVIKEEEHIDVECHESVPVENEIKMKEDIKTPVPISENNIVEEQPPTPAPIKQRKKIKAPIKCFMCEKPKKFATQQLLESHLPQHNDKLPFNCTNCNENLEIICNISFANRHLALHDENRKHKCRFCNYRFFWKRLLIKHEKTHTEKESQRNSYKEYLDRVKVKCYFCDLDLGSEDLLILHFKEHLDILPFTCKLCNDNTARTLNGANRHLQMHDEKERPIKCRTCELRFKNNANRREHEKRRHQENEENPRIKLPTISEKKYQCLHCGRLFTRKEQLKTHELTHFSPSDRCKCKVCGKVLSNKVNLVRHNRLHTGEKPYICSNCPAKFNQAGLLKEHLVIHTGISAISAQKSAFHSTDYRSI